MIELERTKVLNLANFFRIEAEPLSLSKELLSWSKNNHKTTLTEIELHKLLKEPEYKYFYDLVKVMLAEGLLTPVKTSGKNGRLPSLFNKYRIIKPALDYSVYEEKIKHLEPSLNISAYLQKPETYIKHQEMLEDLSRYLWEKNDLLQYPMSRKERSFSIWGREKYLDEHFSLWREVRQFNDLPESVLNYYDTPEPFFEYIHHKTSHSACLTILVLENKDIWFTLRKLLQETSQNRLGNMSIDVLLYGEGNKITKQGALEVYIRDMYGQDMVDTSRVLYCGDFDAEGIRLFFRTQKANPRLQIEPFTLLYQRMLDLAENRELPFSQDNRRLEVPLTEFITLLGLSEPRQNSVINQKRLKFWREGRYIPQEILNYQVLAAMIEKEDQQE